MQLASIKLESEFKYREYFYWGVESLLSEGGLLSKLGSG